MNPLLLYLLSCVIIGGIFIAINFHTKWVLQSDLEDIGPLLFLILFMWPLAIVIALIAFLCIGVKKYLFPK